MSAAAATVGGACLAAAVFTYGLLMPRSSMFGRVVSSGERRCPPRIAITFDDGPHPEATPRILDLLDDLHVQAAFFVIGRNVERFPHVVRDASDRGHIVANHTYSHAHLGALRGLRYWRRELDRTAMLIEQVTGKRPALMRPPMGQKTPIIHLAAQATGHAVVTWSRRAYDGVMTSREAIVRRLGCAVCAGDIVLFHDGIDRNPHRNLSATAEALPLLVRSWRERGLELERLDAVTGLEPYQVERPVSRADQSCASGSPR